MARIAIVFNVECELIGSFSSSLSSNPYPACIIMIHFEKKPQEYK